MKRFILISIVVLIGAVSFAQTASENAYNLTRNETFNKRIEMIMYNVANEVSSSDTTGIGETVYEKRFALAYTVLRPGADIAKNRMAFVRAVASLNSVDESSSDLQLLNAVRTVWNRLSGVKFDD